MSERSRALNRLVRELSQRTGLRIHAGNRDRVDRWLQASDGSERRGADRDTAPEALDALYDLVAIDETYFFRHPEQLDFLRSTVLPRLLDERDDEHVLELWSAGCADGEEPYTLAVILAEEGLGDRSSVLGTDLTSAALTRARRATYSNWSLRSAEVASRPGLFEPGPRRRRHLRASVTEQVTFRQHNLLDTDYPRPARDAGFDVIFCRNVLLHLTPDAVGQVVDRLVAALAPGGWLFTAPADPFPLELTETDDLEAVVLPSGGLVYRRRGSPPTAPTSAPEPRRTPIHREPSPRPAAPEAHPRRRTAPPPSPVPPPAPAPSPDTTAEDARTRCRQAQALLASGQAEAAAAEAMGAGFLEPDLVAAHLTLGLAARDAGRRTVATRAFRRAVELLDAVPAGDPVELCEGETAGSLAELARAHALLLGEPA